MRGVILIFLVLTGGGLVRAQTPEQLFEERILPIFNSPDPSSCTECHLSGVELKNYILPGAKETFANLRDLKLVDLDKPEKSRILTFIRMSQANHETPALNAQRIDPKTRGKELAAFSDWILAAAKDPAFRNAAAPAGAATVAPDSVIRHGRTDRLLNSYIQNLWSLRFRCAGCHLPGGAKFKKHADKHGFEKMAWLRARGPAFSMQVLMESDLLDLEHPERSELLLKPLDDAKEEHGGGVKMRRGDSDYLAILSWIQDYAKVKQGAYKTEADLPRGAPMAGTEIWLRITGLPEHLIKQRVYLAVFPHAESDQPVAVSSTSVVHQPKREMIMANGFLMRRVNSDVALKAGSWVVRLYAAGEEPGPGMFDWDQALDRAKLLYTARTNAEWKPGFKNATVIGHEQLR